MELDGVKEEKTEEEFSPMKVGRKKLFFSIFFQYLTDDGLDMRTRRGYEKK